ncbi:MAG: hypothetical protein F6J86_09925 [Symploca sp. SIO1B1]|nr:hypothetical protein [Symploca sp. SIO1A3]NER94138.1 hypothetical protein [Symploca sp. SIO1B1]
MTNTQSTTGQITFIQNHLPPLEVGEYQLTLRQKISAAGGDLPTIVHKFSVYTERFTLKSGEVIKVFPPANSQGQNTNVLPHVVLSRKTLPWERTPLTDGSFGSDTDYPSWLALLVFDEDDFANDPNAWPINARNSTVSDLKASDNNIFSYFTSAHSISEVLETGETASQACQTIDIPIALFNKIAPASADLKWLAHSRNINRDGEDTDCSVIIANRLPKGELKGKRNIVHLVSLEGLGDYLPTAKGQGSSKLSTYSTIRLVSLKSWAFAAIQEVHSFESYLVDLNTNQPDSHNAFLHWPITDSAASNATAQQALAQGYVAMNHNTREGDQTVSWYRGPLIPYSPVYDITSTSFNPPLLPTRSPDRITNYNKSSGMFDVSYAAAWQLGRLMALANQQFSVALYNWKKDLVQQATRNAPDIRTYRGYLQDVLNSYASGSSTLSDKLNEIRHLFGNQYPQMPSEITKWLAPFWLLQGIPFNYLVADANLLPPESLRFFHVDPSWLNSLIDGALSVGRPTISSWVLDLAFGSGSSGFFAQVRQATQALTGGAPDLTQTSGILLNSGVVQDHWPGFLIDGYAQNADDLSSCSKLTQLYLERLSPTLLMCLFAGEVNGLNIHEPPQGLHFGLDISNECDSGISPNQFKKELKFISGQYQQPDGSNAQIGDHMYATPTATCEETEVAVAITNIPFRNTQSQVLMLDSLASNLHLALKGQGNFNVTGFNHAGMTSGAPFTSAEFALEMVESVQSVAFRLK